MVAPAVVCLRWQPVPRSPADSGVLHGSEEGLQDEPTRTRPAERVRHVSTGASDDFQMQTHFHSVSAFSFDLMSQCWEEKPQSRPTFSSLVVSVANMLSDDYKKVPEFSTVESWMWSQTSCSRFTSCFCVSVTTIWPRTFWRVNSRPSFDPELLEIRIKRQTPTVSSQTHLLVFIHQNFKCRSGNDALFLSTEFPVSQVDVHRSEEEEVDGGKAGPPRGTYVIPVDEINPGAALDAGRYGHQPSTQYLCIIIISV